LKSRRVEVYNPNLRLRRKMLQLTPAKAGAEAATPAPGDAGEVVHFYLPSNGRDIPEESVHAPQYLTIEARAEPAAEDDAA
jgi:hypothetical protein